MKLLSFKKYSEYLNSLGYSIEKGTNVYYGLKFMQYFFSKQGERNKYIVNIFLDKDNNPTDNVIAVNYGYGSPYLGWKRINIDMRKNFWKQFV